MGAAKYIVFYSSQKNESNEINGLMVQFDGLGVSV